RDPARRFASYKISKRFDQDITACLGAFNLRLTQGRVADIRICYGGMAGIPKRARECEKALMGRPWNLATIQEGQAALRRDYTPLSDMRARQAYRALAAENLLLKFFEETEAPLRRTRILEPTHG